MIGRRRFLSLFGMGAAAAPLAAKQAADEAMAAVTSLRGHNAAALAVSPNVDTLSGGMPMAAPDEANRIIARANYLKMFGALPEHVEAAVREDSRYVSALDPDIAAKRSWSMSVKIQEQRARNYERALQRYRNGGRMETAKALFRTASGFDWGW